LHNLLNLPETGGEATRNDAGHVPTLIGEIEQDYLYWPLKYRSIAARWRKDTAWECLFQRYQQQGHLVD